MSSANQETRPTVAGQNTVTMDSRKFLSVINNSAESQIKLLGESVQRMGIEQGKTWNLAATASDRIFIEDVNSGEYLVADYVRQKNGQIKINNLRSVQITEGEKSGIFGDACVALVEGIQSGDHKATDTAFGRIIASRFRSTAVPNSGLVRTKDGNVRHISVRSDLMNEEAQDRLVGIIASELSDKVVIAEGEVTGIFNTQKFRFPVSPIMERRVVAYHMRQRAKNAYWQPEFQDLARTVAGHICEGIEGVKRAVPVVSEFTRKCQELTLLNRNQMNELVGNALATKGIFNESLSDDVSTLIYKTGLKVNRADIMDAWEKTAKSAEHEVMMEGVSKIKTATDADFPGLYDQFLDKFFMTEAIGETTRQGLANALGMLKEKISDPGAQSQIEDLSSRLQNPSTADDQAVWDTMNLMAKTNNQMDNMDQFDAMPGTDAPAPELPPEIAPPASPAAPAQTVININTGGGAPSISGAPDAAPAAPPSDDLSNALDDIDLEGNGEVPPAEPGAAVPPPGAAPGAPLEEPPLQTAGLERTGSPLNEEDASLLDTAMDQWFTENVDGGDPEVSESAVKVVPPAIDPNYGMKVLKEYVINQKLNDLKKMITDKNLKPEDLNDHLDEMAGSALAGDSALSDPATMQKAKEELIGAYTADAAAQKRQVAGAPVSENQIHSPTKVLSRRGLKKAAVNALVTENKLSFLSRNDKAVLGQYKGITFTIDNEQSPVVLLNHDGSVEIPIPEGFVPGALYLAEMTEKESDADTFVEWLDQNIEQLRPITEAEERLVQEAMAKLTVSPDVKIEIGIEGGEGGGVIPPAAPLITEPEPPIVPETEPAGEGEAIIAAGEGGEPKEEESPVEGEIPEEPGDDEEDEDEDDDFGGDEDLEEALKKMFDQSTIAEDKK